MIIYDRCNGKDRVAKVSIFLEGDKTYLRSEIDLCVNCRAQLEVEVKRFCEALPKAAIR